MAEKVPTAIDDTLAIKKNGDHNEKKSKQVKKYSLTIMLKSIILGTDANNKVTLKMEPSYTSHNQE